MSGSVMVDEGREAGPFTVRLPVDVREALDRVAVELERPRAWVVRRAIDQFLAGGAW